MSSLSPSPSPSFNNSASNLHQATPTSTSDHNSSQERTPTNNPQPTITKSGQLKPKDSSSESPSAAYASSKSILFGIPRDYAPMPTIPAQESYSHVSIDSPFVDVTMNNCDDMSLYQPMSKLQLSQQGQHQRASNLTPLAESDISQQSKAISTSSDNYSPAPTPTNLLYSSSAASLPRTNSKNLVSASASNISHYPYQQQKQQHFQHQSFNDIGNASNNSPVGAVCTNSSQNNTSNNQMFGNNSHSGSSSGSNSQNNFKKQEDPMSHMVS